MNEQRIREIANQCSDFAEQIPFFRGVENGLTWEATIMKARDLKFAELIVKECMNVARQQRNPQNLNYKPSERFVEDLRQHFGVEE